jgi:hypothetical protein
MKLEKLTCSEDLVAFGAAASWIHPTSEASRTWVQTRSSPKGVGGPDKYTKTCGTFWQGELASLKVAVFGAGGPMGVGILLRIVPTNVPVTKKKQTFCGGT